MILILFSCTQKESTPEGVLESFISARFNNSPDNQLLRLLTDEVLAEYQEALENQESNTFFNLNNYQQKKFRILSKRCEAQICFLTYELIYLKKGEVKVEFEVKTKKMAHIKNEDGNWKISKIDQIKTFHENKEAIEPLRDSGPQNN